MQVAAGKTHVLSCTAAQQHMFIMKIHDLTGSTCFGNKTPDSYSVIFDLFCKAETIFNEISTKLSTLSANVQPLFMLLVSYWLFGGKTALFFTVASLRYAVLILKVACLLRSGVFWWGGPGRNI